MYKIKIQNQKEKAKKRFFTVLFILIVLLILISIALRFINLDIKKKNVIYTDIKTVEDVLNYYKCKYISETISKLDDYDTDINLIFKNNLYENDISNEKVFTAIIKDIARVLKYNSFRMIDNEKEIEIKVLCQNGKINTIIINDIEDYFIYMDSQIDLKKYEEIKTIDLSVESKEIQELINNDWKSDSYLGTRESIFDGYYEYFDEGIKAKTVSGKIFNIIFTEKYNQNVVDGIYPGMEFSSIKNILGNPSFEDEERKIIGYKGKNIYVFFYNDEISIYKNIDTDTKDFFELVDKFLDDKLDLLDFMNELTYMWPDYSEYEYDENGAFISYPLKGIEIKIGQEGTNGIIIYNNINADINVINSYLQNVEFISRLKIDAIFESEKRRLDKDIEISKKCEEFKENSKTNSGESSKFDIYSESDSNNSITKMNFISKDREYPNREIIDRIDYFLWIDDYIFLYSQSKKGIYAFDLRNGYKELILNGDQTFKLESFESGLLKYDNTEVIVQY